MNFKKIKNDFEEEKVNFFYFEFRFRNGSVKRKRVKFDRKPKKPQGGSGGPEGIKIDELFFDFSDKEKVALLWHELYHCRFFVQKQKAKITSWFDKENYSKNPPEDETNLLWIEEFEADKYSASQNNIKDCLSYLERIEEIYKKTPSLYNPRTHPFIERRIENIIKLKQVAPQKP